MTTKSATKPKKKPSAKTEAYERYRKDLARFRKDTKYLRDEAELLPPSQRRKQLAYLMRDDAVSKPKPYLVMMGDTVIHRTFDFMKAVDIKAAKPGAYVAKMILHPKKK